MLCILHKGYGLAIYMLYRSRGMLCSIFKDATLYRGLIASATSLVPTNIFIMITSKRKIMSLPMLATDVICK